MRKRTRIVSVVAALSLGLVFVLPLWRITLEAPQYPEGLGMYIRVNTITGVGRHDLQNINGLNHYVGMARIEPESFAELRYMPWITVGLMLLGLAAGVTGSRRLLYGWTAVFAVAAVVGLADFYRWEYDYGHNLDPTAAIKVPGLAYQPPLIGSKQLLNFTAHSWPASGGLIAIGAFGVALLMSASEWRDGHGRKRQARSTTTDPAGAPAEASGNAAASARAASGEEVGFTGPTARVRTGV